jgi:hypothetical protein
VALQREGPLFPSLFSAIIIYLPLTVLFYLYFNVFYPFLSAYLTAHPTYVTTWSTNHTLWPPFLHPYHIPTLRNLCVDLQQYVVSPNKNTIFTCNAMRKAQHILKVTVQGPDKSWAIPYMLDGSLSPQHGVSSGCSWRNSLQLQIYWIRSHGQTISGGPPAWRFGMGLTTLHRKKYICYEKCNRASDLDGFFG